MSSKFIEADACAATIELLDDDAPQTLKAASGIPESMAS